MDENQNNNEDHEEYKTPPIKPLWEVSYFNLESENLEVIHVFACCHWCLMDQMESWLDENVGEDNYSIIKMEQLFNINIVNLDFAQYKENEHDIEINAGMVEGQEVDNMVARKCTLCSTMNMIPQGMCKFKCSRCGKENSIANDKKE